jgi:CRP-like cAMP-binding protein
LLTGDVRAATVVATEPGCVYVLDKANFDAALKASPSFEEQIRKIYFQWQT